MHESLSLNSMMRSRSPLLLPPPPTIPSSLILLTCAEKILFSSDQITVLQEAEEKGGSVSRSSLKQLKWEDSRYLLALPYP